MNKDIIVNEFGRVAEARGEDYSHSPKKLATQASNECSKLLNHFQWMSELDSQLITEGEELNKIAADAADTYIYLTILCHKLGLDPWTIVEDKLIANRKKYVLQNGEKCEPAKDDQAVAGTGLGWRDIAKKIADSRKEIQLNAKKNKKKVGFTN